MDQTVSFRLDLGFGVDGASPSGRRSLAGDALTDPSYQAVRSFGFGNVFAGTRGLIAAPLSSYLSLGFRLRPSLEANAPLVSALDGTDDVQLRAVWADAAGVFRTPLLAPLRFRAGRMFAYAPWPVHFDGLMASWQRLVLSITAFAGQRVDAFAPDAASLRHDPIFVAGGSARVDLQAWRGWPALATISATRIGSRDVVEAQIDVRRSARLGMSASVRAIDARPTHQQLRIRSRLTPVSHLVAELFHRQARDWRYDASFVNASDPAAPRRYLELGPTPHQLGGSIRAGTVLLDNIDIAGRFAATQDLADVIGPRPTPASRWAEIGGAVEVRLRRSLMVGAFGTIRDYDLTDSIAMVDVGDVAQALPVDPSAIGTEIFVEGGIALRISLGARRFSAATEVVGRRSRFADLYREDTPDIGDLFDRVEDRGGGRFSVEAWVSQLVRMSVTYEVSTALARAPEINGYKSLRVIAEGGF